MGKKEKLSLYGSLKTSVVGSFPLTYSEENMELALEDQLRAGIDYPSPPQLKDMNLMFLEELSNQGCGIEIREGEAWLVSPLRLPKLSIATSDLDWAISFLRKRKLEAKIDGLKVPITGPITLSSVTKVLKDKYAIEYYDLIFSFADVVSEIVRHFHEHGSKLITIDEPALPYAIWLGIPEDVLIDAINRTLRKVGDSIGSIHVCGRIDKRISNILLRTDALILQHEFKAIPDNVDAYERADLERYGKLLGVGCVQTRADERGIIPIETEKEIGDFILRIGKKFGLENLVVFPDCGFKGLRDYYPNERDAQRVAFKKMLRMVRATGKVRKEKLKA